jgi:hypothetical protein
MDSFKEFYYKRYPSEKRIDDVISEMSVKIPDIPNILEDDFLNVEIASDVLKNGDFIEDFKFKDGLICKVYKYNTVTDSDITLWFIFGEKLIVSKVNFSEYKDGTVVNNTFGRRGYWRGMAGRIYDEYLLNQYKFIMSDNSHTMAGFNLYRSLMNKVYYPNLQISVTDITTDEEFAVKDVIELEKYFGDSTIFMKYRFVVKKI